MEEEREKEEVWRWRGKNGAVRWGVGRRVREMCGGWRERKKKVCREERRKGGRRKGGQGEIRRRRRKGRGRYGGERKGEVWRREDGGGMEEGGRGRYGGRRKGEVWRREEGKERMSKDEGGREETKRKIWREGEEEERRKVITS